MSKGFKKEDIESVFKTHFGEQSLIVMEMDKENGTYYTETAILKIHDRFLTIEDIENWDKNMVQRKSKAYDDVDNFENKMTGNYLFLVNQAESDIPVVTKAVLDEQKRLDALWSAAYKEALNIMDIELPALNKWLLENGVGAINLYHKKN